MKLARNRAVREVYCGDFRVTPQVLSTQGDRRNLLRTMMAVLCLYHGTDNWRTTDVGKRCI